MRRRLTATATALVALALLPITAFFHLVLDQQLEADQRTLLTTRAQAVAASIIINRAGRLQVLESGGESALDAGTWIFDHRGQLVEQPPTGTSPPAGVTALAEVAVPTYRIWGTARLLGQPLPNGGGTVVASLSLLPYTDTENTAALSALLLDFLVLIAVAAITWHTVTRALAPVAVMTRQADEWSTHDLSRRFAPGQARDEISGLADTLNRLLERLTRSLSHERRLTAEIAHELRTPLARMRAEAEIAARSRRTETELRTALTEVAHDSTRIARTVEILLRSHLSTGGATAHSSVAEVLELSRRTVLDRRANLQVGLDPASVNRQVGADAERVLRVLSPVLTNAADYARGQVQVGARCDGSMIEFEIGDDGAGFDLDELQLVFDPGRRGRAGRSGLATVDAGGDRPRLEGVGLGLTLARRLAQELGGTVLAHHHPDGGRVTVLLPAAPP